MKKPAKVYRVLLFCLVIFAGLGDALVGTHNGSLFYFTAECFLCVLRYCNGSSSFRFMLQQVYPYITIYLWLHFVHGYSYDQKYCTCIHNIRLCFFFILCHGLCVLLAPLLPPLLLLSMPLGTSSLWNIIFWCTNVFCEWAPPSFQRINIHEKFICYSSQVQAFSL